VQEEIIHEIEQVKTIVDTYLEHVSFYYEVRGKYIAKVCISFNNLNYILYNANYYISN